MSRIGIVKWADPTGDDPTVYYGLRIDGAYVRRNGSPVGYRSAAEARRAKAAYKAALQNAPKPEVAAEGAPSMAGSGRPSPNPSEPRT